MNKNQHRKTTRQCPQCLSVTDTDEPYCSACDRPFEDDPMHMQIEAEVAQYRQAGQTATTNRLSVLAPPSQNEAPGDVAQTQLDDVQEPADAGLYPAPRSTKTLAVIMATAAAGGTIAAVRHLRQSGLDVGVISSLVLAPAAWSRGIRSYSAPAENDPAFLDRLMAIGSAHPGQVLLPSSDETAWLYTLHAERLSQRFCIYQPSVQCMRRMLDKKLFADAVASAGLAVIPSWKPSSLDHLKNLAPSLPYPILIKPTTHVHRVRNDKGLVAHSREELLSKYQKFVGREEFLAAEKPEADSTLPLLQQFVDVAKEGVYSVTGFIDRSGELFVTRRSVKVFQRSMPIGVGVCFESLPSDPELALAVRRLCLELDYFGMFEVEFLHFGDQWAPIDFNPRLFNQVGMDIRRGMPLPLLACLDAARQTAALRYLVQRAQAEEEYAPAVFCDRFTLRAILLARTLTGRISPDDRAYWLNWLKRNEGNAVDFAADSLDPLPGLIHGLSEIYLGLRAIPRFLQSTPRQAAEILSEVTP